MICTIYSHFLGLEIIQEIIKKNFPKGFVTFRQEDELTIIELVVKGGFLKRNAKLRITYRQRQEPSYQIADVDDDPLVNNLKGLYGFVSSLPTDNEQVKELFLQKILTLNCEFSILQEQGELDGLKPLIQSIAQELDAVLFVQPNTIISQSDSQHFLDKNLNLIIDGEGRCEIDHLAVEINSEYFDADQEQLTADQIERKINSEKILADKEIRINPYLPCIESEIDTVIRSPYEIATRVTVLSLINLVALNIMSGEDVIAYLQKYNLWQNITENEKDFLNNPTEDKKIAESWKCECIWVLLWALNKVEVLDFPDVLCDLSSINPQNYPIGDVNNPDDFIDSITTARAKKEILDANDLYYRFNWACDDARIKGEEISIVHPGVVYERAYALNWLINYMDQDWDNISCDT